MLASWRARPVLSNGCGNFRRGFCCRAEDQSVSVTERQNKKKVVIVGSGWAGLGAAHHLCKQGFDVTVLEGGYELGPKTKSLSPDDAGIRGFWYPYRNIFNLVDELGLKPLYKLDEIGTIFRRRSGGITISMSLFSFQFARLPFTDRLTSLPLMAAVIDFDNTDAAWRKYDPMQYHANDLLPLKDEKIVEKVMSWLSRCIKDFENATVVDKEIGRFPKFLTHFFPGSYKYMMRGSTSFPNLYMAGDWIVNRHGSWSQEKCYVTGVEAANRVVDYVGEGGFGRIVGVEEDEPHIQSLRTFNRNLYDIRAQLPFSDYFLQ
ncbi:UNVERIFIED_CONTAM: hypothetical protein Sangu_0666800 [Sesamum angustifolium]|uniref:Rhodanese domain-containing protein n=1 Tax=Sesamum angustifolium TaxID=2727405 RepID=A0AAW2QCV6_9LAMI